MAIAYHVDKVNNSHSLVLLTYRLIQLIVSCKKQEVEVYFPFGDS